MERTQQLAPPPSPAAEPPTIENLVTTVICPTCRVAVGARCVTRTGKPAREPHGRRFEAVEDAAGITQHRKAQAGDRWWSTGVDRKAEETLLTAYAARLKARLLPRPAVTA